MTLAWYAFFSSVACAALAELFSIVGWVHGAEVAGIAFGYLLGCVSVPAFVYILVKMRRGEADSW